MRRLSPVFVALVLTSLVPLASAAKAKTAPTPLVVSGRGTATFTPRNVEVRMTLTTEHKKADTSRNGNSTKVAGLKTALVGLPGLKPSQVKLGTPSTQLDIQYDNQGKETGRTWITTQTVTVVAKAKDPSNIAGKVYDTGAAHSAEVHQPSPVISERAIEGAKQRAENQALRNAQRRAARMAKTMNLQLTGIASVREPGESFSTPVFAERAMLSRRGGGERTETSFDIGKQTIEETRVVEFQLR